MSGPRRYGQGCAVAHALDMIGERWALLVIRELRLGGRRFSDLQDALPGIGPTVLSQRLRDLEQVGVLARRDLPPPAASRVYELTEWGAELEPVFRALARWGVRSPVVPLDGPVSSDSVMLGLRTFFQPSPEPWTATFEVHIGRDCYVLQVVDGRLESLSRSDGGAGADVVVAAQRDDLVAVLNGEMTVSQALDAGRLDVTGDAGAVQRLTDSRGPSISSK